MKITEIITKLMAGGEVTPEEKSFLDSYQEPDQRERIPKSRLDQEISRKKELEQRLEEMTRRVDEYENNGLSEAEKNRKLIDGYKQQIESLVRERDEVVSARNELESRQRIATVAGEFNFDDRDYLEFLLRRDQIDLADGENLKGYLEELRKTSPKHFRIDAHPGGGAVAAPAAAGGIEFENARTCGDIERMIASAPAVQA